LRARYATQPPLSELTRSIRELASEIADFGTFNFLLSNGEFMFAHCTTHLHFVTRRYPFTTVKLIDCDMQIDLSKHNSMNDVISVIATQPLTTNENWQAFLPGELRVFVDGRSVDVSENPVTL
ncbi:MAG: class II glutamine amidotransferase, partial [Burkholderiaceae bacterium]